MEWMVKSVSKAAGIKTAEKLYQEGYLTEKCLTGEKEALSVFTTTARQELVFQEMKRIVRALFGICGIQTGRNCIEERQ